MGAARKTSGASRRAGGRRGSSTSKCEAGKVREWAKSQGIEVSSRGRIPADLMQRYQAAQ
ncbi:Lsr2 family DNA-binding protein [Streptomyces lavendofoliae]|uniref:Lsr2 family DNA-binding protein n=1 Tax=Streptomyces lavendofoliae TaxID=67314 RepID=UPI003D8C0373